MYMNIYVVKPGDTIQGIANQFGVSPSRLVYDNDIVNDRLVVGQALLILYPRRIYEIQEGDTLYSIASQFNISVLQILRNNSYLLNAYYLIPGETIVIDYEEEQSRDIRIFGYAYSFIKEGLLEEVCLYMDELLPFPYGFSPDGSLIPMRDERLIQAAFQFGCITRMVITPLDRNGVFNNELVAYLLENPDVQLTLINNIYENLDEKKYSGLDVDFEFIPGAYRDAYVSFIGRIKQRFGDTYDVSVAVPPKTSGTQPGLLYEGIDYASLGEVADSIFLMTYEWGYKYGPPMAIAPIPNVRKVLDYAVSVIPISKITMGIPNYAYDWPLPYERDVTVAETIGYTEAIARAYQYGSEILYDEDSKAPYFYYQKEGISHVVWFEDIRSIVAKFDLVEMYGFLGAGYWNLMREFRQNYMYVNVITS